MCPKLTTAVTEAAPRTPFPTPQVLKNKKTLEESFVRSNPDLTGVGGLEPASVQRNPWGQDQARAKRNRGDAKSPLGNGKRGLCTTTELGKRRRQQDDRGGERR